MADWYQFHVEGHLDHTWSAWIGATALEHKSDGTTVFVHLVVDPPALCGVLMRLCNSGVTLIAMRRLANDRGSETVDNS